VIVGVRVIVLVPVKVGEGVLVAIIAETNSVQAVRWISKITLIKDSRKMFLFISIELAASQILIAQL
jgi:hypothetical protein